MMGGVWRRRVAVALGEARDRIRETRESGARVRVVHAHTREVATTVD